MSDPVELEATVAPSAFASSFAPIAIGGISIFSIGWGLVNAILVSTYF